MAGCSGDCSSLALLQHHQALSPRLSLTIPSNRVYTLVAGSPHLPSFLWCLTLSHLLLLSDTNFCCAYSVYRGRLCRTSSFLFPICVVSCCIYGGLCTFGTCGAVLCGTLRPWWWPKERCTRCCRVTQACHQWSGYFFLPYLRKFITNVVVHAKCQLVRKMQYSLEV